MKSIPEQQCSFSSCEKLVVVKSYGLCDGHYRQQHRGAELTPLKQWASPRTGCDYPGCTNVHNAKGFCGGHYQQFLSGVELSDLQRYGPGKWGPWKPLKSGYVARQRRIGGINESQLQHRVVMEEYLNRPLLAHENVHHMNGQRDDNRIENLELWSRAQPSGQRVEDKISWMIEFLSDYGFSVIPVAELDS